MTSAGDARIKINTNLKVGRGSPGLLHLGSGTLDIAFYAAVNGGVILPHFLLVAYTLDGLGVECEGPLGDEGRNEHDSGADTKLKTGNPLACSSKFEAIKSARLTLQPSSNYSRYFRIVQSPGR